MKKNVEKGDLLKSNPLGEFWVCSIVLSFRPKSGDSLAMAHVAVTNAVFDHDFDSSEIDLENLKIIYSKNHEGILVPCIEIHSANLVDDIKVVGQVSAESYYSFPLDFEIGNGSDGGWPQCGPLKKSLGFQSVHQWREVNDRVAWLRDIAEAE